MKEREGTAFFFMYIHPANHRYRRRNICGYFVFRLCSQHNLTCTTFGTWTQGHLFLKAENCNWQFIVNEKSEPGNYGMNIFPFNSQQVWFFSLPSGKELECCSASTTNCGGTDTAVTHKSHWRIPVLIPSFINLSVCKGSNFAKYQAPPGVSSAFVLSFHIYFRTSLPLEDRTNDSAQRTPAHLPTAVPPLQHSPHSN